MFGYHKQEGKQQYRSIAAASTRRYQKISRWLGAGLLLAFLRRTFASGRAAELQTVGNKISHTAFRRACILSSPLCCPGHDLEHAQLPNYRVMLGMREKCSMRPSFGVGHGRKNTEICSKPWLELWTSQRRCGPPRVNQGRSSKPPFGVNHGKEEVNIYSQHTNAVIVDAINKRCAHQGCTKRPPFGIDDGGKKAEFGVQHARLEWCRHTGR